MIEADRTLVLVRHGQTNWNEEGRFQGRLDVPMNAFGRRQSFAVKSQLAGIPFDHAYSSPLYRASETARVITREVPILKDPRLSEIHHGCWQGRTQREISRRRPDQWAQWREQPWFTPEGGEPAAAVRSRVEEFLRSMRGRTILCVSHGVIIQNFLSILFGGSRSQDEVPANASIHTLCFRNRQLCDYRFEMPTVAAVYDRRRFPNRLNFGGHRPPLQYEQNP